MSNFDDKHSKDCVVDGAYDSVVADAIAPESSQVSFQGLACGANSIGRGDFFHVTENSTGCRRRHFPERSERPFRVFNRPGQARASLPPMSTPFLLRCVSVRGSPCRDSSPRCRRAGAATLRARKSSWSVRCGERGCSSEYRDLREFVQPAYSVTSFQRFHVWFPDMVWIETISL